MGDATEVAEISKKKKIQKKNMIGAQTMLLDVVWACFRFVM